jgi:tetratricopeptide (TPR) repeat protein
MKILFLCFLFIGTLLGQQSMVDSLESILEKNPNNLDVKLKLAITYHNMVREKENDDASERAAALFNNILKMDPNHTETMVYYGSLLTLKGRDAFFPWKKMSYVEDGCDLMDKAVKLEPENVSLRIRRAMNNINLPDMFERERYYLEDFQFIRNHPAFSNFNPGLKQQILFNSARAFEKNRQPDKSRELYQQVIEIDKDSKLALQAAKNINELGKK